MNNNHNQEPPPQNNNGPPPMVRPNRQAPRTMEELCQPSFNGHGGPIAPIPIQATDFGLRHHMIQQVQNTCQFPGLSGDDANRHIDKFIEITQHMKQNGVSDDALPVSGYTQETAFATTDNYNSGGSGSLPSNNIPNPQADLKSITTQSGVTLARPSAPPPPSKEVDREPETIMDQVLIRSTNNVPPLVVQLSLASTSFSTISSSKIPEVTKDTTQPSTKNIQPPVAQTQVPIDEPIVSPKPKPSIPYPLRANKQKLRKKDDIIALKFLEIFRNLHFKLSFADALLHMPKFSLKFKSLLNNKEKLFDLATTLANENCSVVILKKLPKKLGDPDKFLIPCDFPELDECLALEDLVVDSVFDPRVPLILRRPFLKIGRALIDVYGEELTLRVDDEAITFKQNQGDVNDAMGSKKKTIMVTSDLLALIAEKKKVSNSKEKVVVSSDSEGRKFYSKPTNNNLRTSSSSQSANKKQEFVKTDNKRVKKKDDEKKRDMSRVKCYNCKKERHFAKDCKKAKVKDYEYYKTKMMFTKKDKDEQVLLAEDQAWMESSSDSDQEINANMVFMAQIEKVLSDFEASSSSADEKISE
nr:reverse transcriptase domain-containing protein [Tanacetum cinerariifolium]